MKKSLQQTLSAPLLLIPSAKSKIPLKGIKVPQIKECKQLFSSTLKVILLLAFAISSPILLFSQPLLAKIHTDYSQIAKPATLKVLLTDKTEGAILDVRGCYDVFDPQTRLPITSSIFGKKSAVYAEKENIKWGDRFPGINQMRIVPRDAETCILINGIEYQGCIEIYNLDGKISIVNEIDIEHFLQSTLSTELSTINNPTLLEALTIIARTNLYYLASRASKAQWHLKASEMDYLGNGVSFQHPLLERAIENTCSIVMTYKKEPFPASWTKNSAGTTASYSTIFRKATHSPKGIMTPLAAKERGKNHWTLSLSKKELAKLAGLHTITNATPYIDQNSAKTYAIHLTDGAFTQDIDFITLQKKVGTDRLKSSDFDIEIKGDKIIFNGWGEGPGVGLCLYSALKMTEQGKNTTAILTHFFPETKIEKIKKL